MLRTTDCLEPEHRMSGNELTFSIDRLLSGVEIPLLDVGLPERRR